MGDDIQELIRGAFEQARRSGVVDWRRMTAAVLKNRLLLITHGKFNERAYGARSFTAWLATVPELVSLDRTKYPPIVELIDDGRAGESPPADREYAITRGRIRPDLWRAILDFAGERAYIWDSEKNKAIPASGLTDAPRLPTLTAGEFQQWRKEFADASSANLDVADVERLMTWLEHSAPTRLLPSSLRGPWNGELKRRTEERLRAWFDAHHLSAPNDLVEQPTIARHQERQAEVEQLRRFIVDCIRCMSAEELARLDLPSTAVLRLAKRQ